MIHGTLETIDDHPTLRFTLSLADPVERAWRAVSVPAELERWFPASVDWTPAVGETFEAGGATLEVTEVDPPQRLAWTYAGLPQSFEVAAEGDGCRLTFTCAIDDDLTLVAQTATGWEAYLLRLDPHLRGEHVTEEMAHEKWAEIHERYAELFGVDPEPGRKFAAALRARQG
ncbi:SRPBCC domain-containing protein [Rhodococcus tukisamuensis]|uniref:Activator of Hsp90 ATPase homolog 1-like protein n=1 Tax=Rhodococcus tukisamuensis TaxID=168276 RepID=A0A1G6UT61_9NOCA|nr:SRPBCC domain-containing protein [Rhodococcus tukisamuensis]SDD44610.1 Activator of Hsp90 ATPase homolog 1-like protein [Rhodococcus tukisamuensis]